MYEVTRDYYHGHYKVLGLFDTYDEAQNCIAYKQGELSEDKKGYIHFTEIKNGIENSKLISEFYHDEIISIIKG